MKNTITIHKNLLQVLIALIYYLWQLCVRSIWFAFDFSANYVFYSLLIRILCKFSCILLLPHNFSCKMFKCKCSLYCYCAWMRVYVCVRVCANVVDLNISLKILLPLLCWLAFQQSGVFYFRSIAHTGGIFNCNLWFYFFL